MAKERTTEINCEVLGYGEPRWGYTHGFADEVLRVRVMGRGPKGKLSGIVEISPAGVGIEGDGRFSAMHGSSSLSYNDPIKTEIEALAGKAAAKWVTANPGAFEVYRIGVAEAAVEKAHSDLIYAEELVLQRQRTLAKAEETLAALKGAR